MSTVPRQSTPATELEVVQPLLHALQDQGLDVSRQAARLMLAQLWLESGRGQRIQNYNPGNLMARFFKNGSEVSVWSGNFWRPPWFEDESHKTHSLMVDGKEPSAFRAYPSLDEGIASYVELLSRKAPLLEAFKSGDPSRVARAIVSTGYCPACPVSQTAGTLKSLAGDFAKSGLFNSLPDVPPAAGAGLLWAGVLGTVGFIFLRTVRKA